MSDSVSIAAVTAEHHHSGFGISSATPRLSWRYKSTSAKDWVQTSYEIVITRRGKDEDYKVDSASSILVPWPSSPLVSRERAAVKVRTHGAGGSSTAWATLDIEAALFERSEWKASLISRPPYQKPELPKRPFRLRKTFSVDSKGTARLYATAHGMYEVEINGQRVGDEILAPGWQSYHHRLHYQTYDVTKYLKQGENTIGVYVAEGWYCGRLGRPGQRNIWGERPGFMGQLEVDGKTVVMSDNTWDWLEGPVLLSEIYNGESFDSRLDDPAWVTAAKSIGKVELLPPPSAELVAPDVAPVRRIMEVRPAELITTKSGKKVLDFGQNLVGWLRFDEEVKGKAGDELVLRHAEVMENGELGIRPLRTAKATDTIILGGKIKGWEARFTFHGFR